MKYLVELKATIIICITFKINFRQIIKSEQKCKKNLKKYVALSWILCPNYSMLKYLLKSSTQNHGFPFSKQ